MDAAERIADYLSDDLTPDERAAFEAELDGDAALRAQLDAARRAETALAALPPTALPAGFTDRLRAAVDTELADLLAPDTDEAPDPRVAAEAQLGHHDELAARRAGRTPPRWTGFVGAAAAAVLVVVAGVAGLSTLGAGDDAGNSAADMAQPESAEMEDDAGEAPASGDGAAAGSSDEAADAEIQRAPEPEAAEDAGDDAAETEGGETATEDSDSPFSESDAGAAPLILTAERRLDDGDLDAILIAPELQQVAGRQLDAASGRQLATDWRQALVTAGDRSAARDDGVRAQERGAVTDADREAVATCVAAALDPQPDAIPAYAELAEYDGRAAVILGLVVPDPNTGDYARTEVQARDRDTCTVLTTRP